MTIEATKALSLSFKARIQAGVEVLKRGGVIAFPTDTVYGIGAHAGIEAAVEKVYRIKQRPRHMALPLLLASVSQIELVAEEIPPLARFLAQRFLPGPLTLVLHKATSVSGLITAGGDTVAIRVPNHPVPLALVQELGSPMVGTSANRSGQPSALSIEEIKKQLGEELDLVLDEGPRPGGKESTIVDLTQCPPLVVREGAISRRTIEKALREMGTGLEKVQG